MAGVSTIANVWKNIKEIDLRPLRQDALRVVKLAVVGQAKAGREALADQLRRDPARSGVEVDSPLLVVGPDSANLADEADLIILVVQSGAIDNRQEQDLVRLWTQSGKRVLVLVDQAPSQPTAIQIHWGQTQAVFGSLDDIDFLSSEFVPAVMALLPDRLLALGRQFPLFRVPIARKLINETSFSNAAYALSTGLAEVVPVFDIPLNVADVVVLTKAQAFLVYKLGLALGLSTDWQDYVAEFSSVLGGGFLWRQLARSLVGLIPAWGIIPKVSVAYAGTFVVGNVVLQWYLTGRHVTRKQMRELYAQAFARGKDVARNMLSKVPQPRLRKRRLSALPAPDDGQVCPSCGRSSALDASFCQYCGYEFDQQRESPPKTSAA